MTMRNPLCEIAELLLAPPKSRSVPYCRQRPLLAVFGLIACTAAGLATLTAESQDTAPPPPSEQVTEAPLDPSKHTLVLRGTGGAIVFSADGHSPTLSVTEFTAEETRTWTVELDTLIKSLPRTMRKLSTGKDQ